MQCFIWYLEEKCPVAVESSSDETNGNNIRLELNLEFAEVQHPGKFVKLFHFHFPAHSVTDQPNTKIHAHKSCYNAGKCNKKLKEVYFLNSNVQQQSLYYVLALHMHNSMVCHLKIICKSVNLCVLLSLGVAGCADCINWPGQGSILLFFIGQRHNRFFDLFKKTLQYEVILALLPVKLKLGGNKIH